VASAERPFSHLVVIGASAGGIEALSRLVATLPRSFPAPVVVAQHISPHRTSALAEILARSGPLRVRTIEGHEALKPGVIYVVPPNRNVMITDHEVALQEHGAGPQPSIDLLFRSAAQVFGENLIAVVLSGSGSDGSAGAREVKYGGGTVVIENPDTAAFPSMPLSLAPSVVDIAANIDRIGDVLNELATGEYIVPPVTEQSHLRAFLEEIREQSGIDFTTYKQPTILRRLKRRMMATNQASIADYVRYVHQRPEERQRLIANFLIKVTEFFRDPELYSYLRDHVMPELVNEARERGGELRLWSAGCATGEEAYSLAMVVADALDDGRTDITTRIFATDLDEEAVAFARRGIYPARSLVHLPEEMVTRHFTPYGDDYEVRKGLRSMLVFGEHDLGQRAPFPRIDLILCRNVLIYFTPALQRRALQLFAFSLRSGGYMALGKSETVSPLAEYFAVDQPRLKIYRRAGERALIPPSRFLDTMHQPAMSTRAPVPTPRAQKSGRDPIRPSAWHGDHVLLGLPFGVVVIDRNYDIKFLNGTARRIFSIHTTALEQDFIHLIQHFDPVAIRRSIDETLSTGSPTTVTVRAADTAVEDPTVLEVTCALIERGDDGVNTLAVLSVHDISEREALRNAQVAASEAHARLARANDEVLAANDELTRTIARLRAENEDLLVATEEIQAATEEVETLNEELQASNEELETLNEELQATVEELNTTNDDLQARSVELQAMAFEAEAARQQLRATLDGIDAGVVVFNAAGTIIARNSAWDALGLDDFDLPMMEADGSEIADADLPPARAVRNEAFTLVFAVDRGSTRSWYEANGHPMPVNAHDRLLVVTVREVDDPGA